MRAALMYSLRNRGGKCAVKMSMECSVCSKPFRCVDSLLVLFKCLAIDHSRRRLIRVIDRFYMEAAAFIDPNCLNDARLKFKREVTFEERCNDEAK